MSLGQQIFAMRRAGRNTLHAFYLCCALVLPNKITIRAGQQPLPYDCKELLLHAYRSRHIAPYSHCSSCSRHCRILIRSFSSVGFFHRSTCVCLGGLPVGYPEHGVSQTWGTKSDTPTSAPSVRTWQMSPGVWRRWACCTKSFWRRGAAFDKRSRVGVSIVLHMMCIYTMYNLRIKLHTQCL